MPDLTWADWTVVAVAIFLGGIATGAGGFGFAIVTTPILLWVLPPGVITLTNLAMSVMLRLPLIYHDREFVVRREARSLLVGGLLGLPLGIVVLRLLSGRDFKLFASAVIVVMGIPYLLRPGRIPRVRILAGPTGVLVGVISGTLNTSTSVSGPPMVLWLMNQRLVGRPFRATLSAVGVLLNFVGVVLLLAAGPIGLRSLLLPVSLLPVAGAGMLFGDRLLARVPDDLFIRGTAMLVIASGIFGLLNSL